MNNPLIAGAIIQIGVVKVIPNFMNWFNNSPSIQTINPSTGPYRSAVNIVARGPNPIFMFPILKDK